jgi:hypothetical protein
MKSSSLTTDDVSPSSLERKEAQVQHLSRVVDTCRKQLADAEAELALASDSLSWCRLMKDVLQNEAARQTLQTLSKGIQTFEGNLSEPAGYNKEDNDGVPFAASDDYADFSSVEAAVDTVTDSIESLMLEGDWEGGFLSLLVLTTKIGQMSERGEEVLTALRDVEYDEMKEEIAGLWTRFAGYREGGVPDSVAAKWRAVVERHIGAPYDAFVS